MDSLGKELVGYVKSKGTKLNIKRVFTLTLSLTLMLQSTLTAFAVDLTETPVELPEAVTIVETETGESLSDNSLVPEQTEDNNLNNVESTEILDKVEEKRLDYEYHDAEISVEVKLPEDTSVPSNSVLVVTEITQDNTEFNELTEVAKDTLETEIKSIQLFDISFYTENNEYIDVDDTAEVKITTNKISLEADDLKVIHYENNTNPVEIMDVTAIDDVVTFTTDGFSIFALVEIEGDISGDVGFTRVHNIDATALDGKSYIITSKNAKYMLGKSYHNGESGKLGAHEVSSLSESDYVYHVFEKISGSERLYKIYTVINGAKYYLKLSGASGDGMGLHGTSVVANATIFKIENVGDDNIYIRYNDNDRYFINLSGGETSHNGFMAWKTDDDGSKIALCNESEIQTKYVNDLDGRDFAIVSHASNTKFVSATALSEGTRVSAVEASIADEKHVYGDNITYWTFEATDAVHGQYYVSTVDENGNTLYLNVSSDSETVSLDSTKPTNPLTIIDEGNYNITINSGGRVLDNYTYQNMFGSWTYTGSTNQMFKLYEREESYIKYDLNFQFKEHDRGWIGGKPTVETNMQVVDANTTLSGINGTISSDGYYSNLTFYTDTPDMSANIVGGDDVAHVNGYLAQQNRPNGSDYEFLGWETEVNGTTYYFNVNADVEFSEGNILVTDVNNEKIVVPAGNVFKGRWKQVRDIALFYINYRGLINEYPDPPYNDFTPCVGIAYVYNGDAERLFGVEYDTDISSYIVPEFDETSDDMQIVVQYVRFKDNDSFMLTKDVEGLTEADFEQLILECLSESNHEMNLHIGKMNSVRVNTADLHGENYDIRWYKLADEYDAWHIDGLVTETPKDVEIQLKVNGLDNSELDAYFNVEANTNTDEYDSTTGKVGVNVDVVTDLGNGNEAIKSFDLYASNNLDDTEAERFSFLGYDEGYGLTTYFWSVPTASLSDYVFSVDNADISGYNCITVIEIVLEDGTVVTVEDTEVNIRDYETDTNKVNTVRIYKTYTQDNTVMLSILNKASDSDAVLAGSEFKLYNADKSVDLTLYTDPNGNILVNDLPVGDYTLEHTKAADGYELNAETKYDIKVTTTDSGELVLLVNGETPLYKVENGEVTLFNQLVVTNDLAVVMKYQFKVIWDDKCEESKIPESLTIKVKQIREVQTFAATGSTSYTLNKANNWSVTWDDYSGLDYEVTYELPDGFTGVLKTTETAELYLMELKVTPEVKSDESDKSDKDPDKKEETKEEVKDNKTEENKTADTDTKNDNTTSTTGTPDKSTGDNSSLVAWASLLVISALMCVLTLKRNKR